MDHRGIVFDAWLGKPEKGNRRKVLLELADGVCQATPGKLLCFQDGRPLEEAVTTTKWDSSGRKPGLNIKVGAHGVFMQLQHVVTAYSERPDVFMGDRATASWVSQGPLRQPNPPARAFCNPLALFRRPAAQTTDGDGKLRSFAADDWNGEEWVLRRMCGELAKHFGVAGDMHSLLWGADNHHFYEIPEFTQLMDLPSYELAAAGAKDLAADMAVYLRLGDDDSPAAHGTDDCPIDLT